MQAPGRGDEDVDAASHGVDLRTERHAAVHGGDGEARLLAVDAEAVGDLRGQLTRRREDERARAAAQRRLPVGGEAMQHRQREGRGLAGARLGDAHEVATGEHAGNGLRLNGGWSCVAFGFQCLQQQRIEAELGKRGRVGSRVCRRRRSGSGQFHIFHDCGPRAQTAAKRNAWPSASERGGTQESPAWPGLSYGKGDQRRSTGGQQKRPKGLKSLSVHAAGAPMAARDCPRRCRYMSCPRPGYKARIAACSICS